MRNYIDNCFFFQVPLAIVYIQMGKIRPAVDMGSRQQFLCDSRLLRLARTTLTPILDQPNAMVASRRCIFRLAFELRSLLDILRR